MTLSYVDLLYLLGERLPGRQVLKVPAQNKRELKLTKRTGVVTPDQGIEPWTTRLKVGRSTD
jgi:hypothetical protein